MIRPVKNVLEQMFGMLIRVPAVLKIILLVPHAILQKNGMRFLRYAVV